MSTGFELPGEDGSPGARPTFGSVRRGYDPDEVDAFLAQIASGIQLLEQRVRRTVGETPDDVSDRLAKRFASLLATQEHEAEALVTEAHIEAATIVGKAKQEADSILSQERDAAERSVTHAYAFRERAAEEAEHLRSDLDDRRRDMIERLPQVRQRLITFLREVEVTLDSIEIPNGGEGSTSRDIVDEASSPS